MGRKLGAPPLFGQGALGPHLTQCGRGLPACQVSSWSVQPFGHSKPQRHRQTDRTDRQRSDSIGRTVLQTVAQKRLNRSICRLGCRLDRAKGCTSSIVFARRCQCALMGGHIAATWRIRLNHPSTATMRLMSNYCDHLLSLDTRT